MEDVKKPEDKPAQAPAQPAPKVEDKKIEEEQPKAQPSGLDALNPDQLRELYKKSPQMFKEAGIVKEEPAPEKPKPVEQPKVEPEKPAPQAPLAMNGVEIKLPTDVPVNRTVMEEYIVHAKEIGLSPVQVQAELDFQVKKARDALKAQPQTPKQKTEAEIDAENVASLKADKEFGSKYDDNMELARRAAVKFGTPEILSRLSTSDPVLVKHFWKLGKADADDSTRGGPNRNGNEGEDKVKSETDQLKARYPNSPSMFRGSQP